jgi:tetratricopeptide (TPR) repeat protein/transglutaminase-like putative cysteine protease
MLPRRTLVLLLAVAGSAWLHADFRAEQSPVPRGASHEPQPHRYDPKAAVPRAFLEDAPAVVLYTATTYLVEEDGTLETTTHEITRLNSRKGVERLGEYRGISYDPTYQKLILHEARVHKPDGKAVSVGPRSVQVRDASTDFSVYDQNKQVVISFPNLQVGDVIEVKWTTRGKNPERFGHFFTRYSFGDDRYPTVREELRIRVPKTKPLTFVSNNGRVDPVVQDEGNATFYLWAVNDRPEAPSDDSLPSRETMRLEVACTTFGSWAEVGEWKQKLRAKCWECTSEIHDVVREVTKGLTDPTDKTRALTYWVRKRIRYVSVSASGSGYTPQLPARCLANLYGDCKDQAQLLAVMLRDVGVKVELVTLGTLDDGQILPAVPMPWGTHAILLVTIDGKQHWIDTTVTNAPWDYLPRDDRDRVTYVTDEGNIRLLRTPSPITIDHRYEQTTHVKVLTDGTAVCRRKMTYHGAAALMTRDSWLDAAPGERRRLMAAELQDANSRTRLRRLAVDEASLVDFDGPVRAEVDYDIPAQFTGGLDKEGSLSDPKVWNRLLGYTLDHDRKLPLQFGTPAESYHKYVIELPPAYRFDGLPREQKVVSKWGSFRVKVKQDPGAPRRLEVTFLLRLDRTLVEPADFAEFRKFHDEVYRSWRVWLYFTPTRDPADIPMLTAQTFLAPTDTGTSAVLAQLLYDTGSRDEAREVLRMARALRPTDATLWEMSVRMAPTWEEQAQTYETMLIHFPDNSKYAVELGSLRVKLGDYAAARTVLKPLVNSSTDAVKAQALLELARADLAQGKPQQALVQLTAARAAGADGSRAVQSALLHAEILEALGEPQQAAEAYRRALRAETDNDTALAALVRLELAADNRGEALDLLRRYALAVGDDRDGLVQAAEWYLQLARPDDALDLALRARQMKFTARTQRVLGLIYAELGDPAKSVLHLSRATPDAEVLLGLLRGYLALGRLRDAAELLPQCDALEQPPQQLTKLAALVRKLDGRRAWLMADPRIPFARRGPWAEAIDAVLCAAWAHDSGKPAAQVEALVSDALAACPEYGPAYALRALAHLERGRLTKALADADHAVRLDPWDATGYYVRGRVRLERGDKEALADLARAALLSKRGDGWILHWLAAAQFQAGQYDKALATQTEAAQLRPQEAEIVEQLREFEKAVQGR